MSQQRVTSPDLVLPWGRTREWALRELLPLAQSHVAYGVTAGMYGPVGEALFATLREACGDAFDAECERVWREAYQSITRAMLD